MWGVKRTYKSIYINIRSFFYLTPRQFGSWSQSWLFIGVIYLILMEKILQLFVFWGWFFRCQLPYLRFLFAGQEEFLHLTSFDPYAHPSLSMTDWTRTGWLYSSLGYPRLVKSIQSRGQVSWVQVHCYKAVVTYSSSMMILTLL